MSILRLSFSLVQRAIAQHSINIASSNDEMAAGGTLTNAKCEVVVERPERHKHEQSASTFCEIATAVTGLTVDIHSA